MSVPPAHVAPSGSGTATVVVAFDVDGTLTTRDCVVPFLRRIGGTRRTMLGVVARPAALVPALMRRDRDALKAVAARPAFAGRLLSDVAAEAKRYADEIAAGWLRHDTVSRLGWHREQGHRIVLVSASFELYLEHLGEHLGVDDVLATRLAVIDGRLTGALDGPNCRGPEKRRRLLGWIDEHFGERAGVEVWAYGDSSGDRELLEEADHGVWATGPISSVPGS